MQTLNKINATQVRHNWPDLAAGVAAGKTYLVENYGKPEALVMSPDALKESVFDLEAHFAKVQARPPTPLAKVEVTRSAEV